MATLFANGQHEDLGGGVFRTTLGLRPVNYLSGGGYLPIVNDWVDGDEGNPHVVEAAPLRVRADTVGRRNFYPIPGDDSVYLSVGRPWYQPAGGWQPAPMNPLQRVNNRLQSINPNYNLYLDQGGHLGKLGILLKGGFVPPNNHFAFPFNAVGLTRTGNILYHDGLPVMILKVPVVYDWNNPEDERPITFNFTSVGGQPVVVFILPDLTGMSLPLVDPTLTLQPGAADGLDTFVRNDSPGTNFGTQTTLELRATTSIRNSLAKFDLSSIPPGATPTGGSFSAWNDNVIATNHTVVLARILPANSTWTEGGATWNFGNGVARWAGDAGSDGGADAGCSVSGTDYSSTDMGSFVVETTDVVGTEQTATLLVSELAAMLAANHGLQFRTGTNTRLDLRSSDHATAANRPKLVAEYTLPAGGIFWPGVLSSAVFDGAIVR